jgi:hypothetical protein
MSIEYLNLVKMKDFEAACQYYETGIKKIAKESKIITRDEKSKKIQVLC